MNDRFRFRAWDKKNKRMLYNIQEAYDGGCVEDKEGELVEDYISVCCFASFFPYEGQKENHYIVEQCTGLKDKNGKLIYEGDILRRKDSAGRMVEWDENELAFFFTTLDKETSTPLACYDMQELELEIFGNIHENSELLEAEK